MFRRKRHSRKDLDALINALAASASDPRRQALADVIETVLKRAGYTQAPVNDMGYPTETGFWMRVDSIGGGVMLLYNRVGALARDPESTQHNVLFVQILRAAFAPVLGSQVDQFVQLRFEGEMVGVYVPHDHLLAQLHQSLR